MFICLNDNKKWLPKVFSTKWMATNSSDLERDKTIRVRFVLEFFTKHSSLSPQLPLKKSYPPSEGQHTHRILFDNTKKIVRVREFLEFFWIPSISPITLEKFFPPSYCNCRVSEIQHNNLSPKISYWREIYSVGKKLVINNFFLFYLIICVVNHSRTLFMMKPCKYFSLFSSCAVIILYTVFVLQLSTQPNIFCGDNWYFIF